MKVSQQHIKILEAYAEEAPKEIYRHYRGDSCLVSTRISLEVLKKLHFKDVRTMAVEVNIFNPLYSSKGRLPESHEEAEAWKAEGAWQIVVGDMTVEHPPDYWPGHIVTIVNGTTMIDLSIAAAGRADKNIVMRPVLTTVPECFVKGEDKCALMVNDCMVIYEPRIKDVSYQGIKDWHNKARVAPVVSDIIEAVKWRTKNVVLSKVS